MKKILLFIMIILNLTSVSVGAVEIGGESYIVETDGKFIDVSNSTYKEKGEWSDFGYVGYDNKKIRVCDENGASAQWTQTISPQGQYEIYFWKAVIPGGAKDAEVICASNVNSASVKVDFSRGESGWIRVGVVDIPDSFFGVELKAGEGGGKIAACCYRIVATDMFTFTFDRIYDKNPDAMIFKVDSKKAFYSHDEYEIPDVAPQITNARTMLPLRFVSENMGAEVEWKESDRSVTVNYDNHTVVFYVGSTKYISDGAEKVLDVPPQIINNRTVIPMRALCENLGKDVLWHDSGIILIAETVELDDDKKEEFYLACESVF